MKDVFKDDTLNGWILTPATNLVEFIGAEQAVCGTSLRGYYALATLPDVLSLLKHLPKPFASAVALIAGLVKQAPQDAAFAQTEIDAGFSTIYAHHTIAIWAAIETTIEQIFVSYLIRTPDSQAHLLAAAPTLKASKVKTDTPKNAKRAVTMWQATLDDPSNIGRALTMLAALGFAADLPASARQNLDEMSEIRNIVLHRAGFLDETFLAKCPWFKAPADGRLKIDEAMMNRYFHAAGELAIALISAVVGSPHIKVSPSV